MEMAEKCNRDNYTHMKKKKKKKKDERSLHEVIAEVYKGNSA